MTTIIGLYLELFYEIGMLKSNDNRTICTLS